MGSIALIILALTILSILVMLVGKVVDRLGYSRKIIDIIKKKLFWNMFLRTSLQAYIKVLFVYLTLMVSLKFQGFISTIKSIFTILVVAILVALPALYTFILYRNRDSLEHESIRNKIGSLYVGVLTKDIFHYLYSIVFLIRRLIYVALLITLKEIPVLFSQGLIILNMMYLYYLIATKPQDSRSSLLMEMFNEGMLQLISYHILLTGFRNDFK